MQASNESADRWARTYDEGLARLAEGDYDGAAGKFDSLPPDYRDARARSKHVREMAERGRMALSKATEYLAEGDLQRAAGQLAIACKLWPKDDALRSKLDRVQAEIAASLSANRDLDEANKLLGEGRLEAAREVCERVLQKVPGHPYATKLLQKTVRPKAYNLPSTKRAKRRVVVQPEPMAPGTRRRVVLSIFLTTVTLLALVGIFSIRPYYRHSRMRTRLAKAERLLRDARAEEAIAEYAEIAKDYPGSSAAVKADLERERLESYVAEASAMKQEADAAFRRQDFEEAMALYEATAEKFPLCGRGTAARESIPGCARLACAKLDGQALDAERARRWDVAKTIYGRILAILPEYPYAAEGLQQAKDTLAQFQRVLEKAQATEKAGHWSNARTQYERALAILPESTSAFDGRARALRHIPPPKGMVLIEPGDFVMGADNGEPDEGPRRTLRTYGFYMDVTELTNAEYARFITETGRVPPPHWGGDLPPPEIDDLPVVCVSWYDATAYAAWAGKRLPTEIEWERAARGHDGRKYPWGDSLGGAEAAFGRTAAPVGRIPSDRSQEGCLDMGGNVSEWTSTAVPLPPGSLGKRRTVDTNSRCKIVRGTSWAGLEAQRSNRIVPARIAGEASDPTCSVLVDHPSVWGIEAYGLAEIEFFLRGVANRIPVIEIRKWLPSPGKYVSARFLIPPGEEIAGEREMRIGSGQEARNVRIVFLTGYRMVRIGIPDDPTGMYITYTDASGTEYKMIRSRPATTELTSPAPAGAAASSTGARSAGAAFEKVVSALSQRPLSDVARSANRMAAPPDARFINCGFRCVKDP